MRFLMKLGSFWMLTSVMLFILAWADTRHLEQGGLPHRDEFNVVVFKPDGQIDGFYNTMQNTIAYPLAQLIPIHPDGSLHKDGVDYFYHRKTKLDRTVLEVTASDADSKHVSTYYVGTKGVVPQTTYLRSFDYIFMAANIALGLMVLVPVLLMLWMALREKLQSDDVKGIQG